MLSLLRRCAREFGVPRFVVTDHGRQFRTRFRHALGCLGVTLVKGRSNPCAFNGKVERFFRTLRVWQRLTLFAWKAEWIQKRLDAYREWYNTARPMGVLDGRTPEEMWTGKTPPEAASYRASDPTEPVFRVTRHGFRGDPRLTVIEIAFTQRLKRPA